ncbi:MAG: MmgE/PrpD family protein [Erythrobacter sp.]|uniref:MmgE/PrpD family protein n=1 Tax=Erythrobacter sp. TaxID=1042 RepID=UPI0032667D8D
MTKVNHPVELQSRIDGETTNRLVDLILGASLADMDPRALVDAKKFLADSMVVGVGGVSNRASGKVFAAARKWDAGSKGRCGVLGRPGAQLSPHSAAVVNGFQIHCLEWDALHEPSVVIALCTPVAAILSEGQVGKAKLDDCLFALTVAVEVAVLFGAAAKGHPRFFRPSAAGLMGAAVAVGLLRGFDRNEMTQLLGLAYSQVSGTMQAHWEGSEALPMQIGIAARAALTAADLAQAGLGGPVDIIDGKFGYFNLIEAGGEVEPHLQKFGDPWKISEVAHKPFPAGRATQATLTAIMDMEEKAAFPMDDVAAITAYVPPLILLLVGRPYMPDMEAAYARLCLSCIAPMMIRQGRIDPTLFTERHFSVPEALLDAQKVNVVLNDNPDPNALGPQRIVLELKDGRVFEQDVIVPFGSPDRPLSREDEIAKAKLSFTAARFACDESSMFAVFDASDETTSFAEIVELFTKPIRADSCL